MRHIFTLVTFLFSTFCFGQFTALTKNENVTILFNKTEIDDTIIIENTDLIQSYYDRTYLFTFRNTGVEKLRILYSGGADPCFMLDPPKDEIEPGVESALKIYCPGSRAKSIEYNRNTFHSDSLSGTLKLTILRQWKLQSNAKNDVTLVVRQTFVVK